MHQSSTCITSAQCAKHRYQSSTYSRPNQYNYATHQPQMGRYLPNSEDTLRYADYVCTLVEGGRGRGVVTTIDKGEVMGSSINFMQKKKRWLIWSPDQSLYKMRGCIRLSFSTFRMGHPHNFHSGDSVNQANIGNVTCILGHEMV